MKRLILAATILAAAITIPVVNAEACGGPCPTTTSTTSTTTPPTTEPPETTTTAPVTTSTVPDVPPVVQCLGEPEAHERTAADDSPAACQPPTTPKFTG